MKKLKYLKNPYLSFCAMRLLMVLNQFRLATKFGRKSDFSFQKS